MLRHLFCDASWVNSFVPKSDNQKRGKPAEAVRRAALASVESLESRQLLSAGQLDTSFGAGGQVELTPQGTIYASAVQSDGKIVLAGGTLLNGTSGTSSLLVERVTANGAIDTSFGTNGVVTTAFSSSTKALAVVVEGDGKIVVGGGQALARYNADGSLDTTFGTGGKVTISASSDINIQSLTVSANDQVIVGGRTTYQDPAHPSDPNYALPAFSVARYNANGTLDTSFNSTGTFIEQISDSTNGVIAAPGPTPTIAVALQPDGKVLVGGNFKIDPAVWRLDIDGTLDTSFGHGGMATIPMQYYDESQDELNSGMVTQLIVQPDGKILAGGFANFQDVPYNYFAVARFNADGSPDTTFGNTDFAPGGGLIAVPQSGGGSGATQSASLLLQPDGKIILGGSPGLGLDSIIRFTADGLVDPTFQFTNYDFDPNGFSDFYPSVDLTPDGQIILVDNPNVTGSSTQMTGLIRVQNNYVASTSLPASTKNVNVAAGGINPTFGAEGDVIVNDPTTVWAQSSRQRAVRATAVQADGKILIAGSIGTVSTNGIGEIFVERLNADGSTDTTFGTDGFVETAIGAFSIADSIAIQSDRKIVIGGVTEDSATSPTNQEFALARYTAAGVLDTTFGTNGTVTTDFTGNEQIDAIAVASGGQIVAAGSYFQNPDVGFHVVRYTSSGSLDTTFDTTGKLTVNLGTPASGEPSFPTSLAVQLDEKILIGSRSGGNAAIYRYNINGSLDGGFGSGGIALNPSTTATGGSISAIAVLSNGQIIAAAADLDQTSAESPIDLVRFSLSGIADSTFGTGGVAVLDNLTLGGTPESEPLDPTFPTYLTVDLLAPQTDGGIVAVGTRLSVVGNGFNGAIGLVPLVVKVTSDGSTDSTFTDSADPGFVPPPYYRGEVVRAAAAAPDGSIVVAADVYADTIANPPAGGHEITAPHLIGVTNYITQATTYQIAVPASGVDFTPTNSGGGGGGGGGGNPLPAGQLTATIPTALPKRVIGGTRGVLNIQLKNTGATTFSGPISIGLYSSLDSRVSTDDSRLTTLTLSSVILKPGTTRTIRIPFNYASTQATGNYEILANLVETSQTTASYVAVSKRAIHVVQPTADLTMTVSPTGPLQLKAGKKTRIVLIIKNRGTVAAVGTVKGTIYAINGAGPGDVELAEKTIEHFRLAKNATRRLTVDYKPVDTFGPSFNIEVQMIGNVTPNNPNSNGNGVANVLVTLI